MKNVAIQGEIGSFHHSAATKWYQNALTIVPCTSFRDVFVALDEGLADSAVIAIENTLYGSINEVYDLLLRHRYLIAGEVLEPIKQCLIGTQEANLNGLEHIHSHPVALSQCSDFLREELPRAKLIENFDTAASVGLVKQIGHKNRAAIASKIAAEIYDMKVLKEGIQNHDANFTRFLIIERTLKAEKTDKVSVVITTNHQPGALYNALGIFNDAGLNLTKLQSRPIAGEPWHYMFYLDLEASRNQFEKCLNKLDQLGYNIKVLGYYNAFTD